MGEFAPIDLKQLGDRHGYSVRKLVEAGDWAALDEVVARRRHFVARGLNRFGWIVASFAVLAGVAWMLLGGPWQPEDIVSVILLTLGFAISGMQLVGLASELRAIERLRADVGAYRRATEPVPRAVAEPEPERA